MYNGQHGGGGGGDHAVLPPLKKGHEDHSEVICC